MSRPTEGGILTTVAVIALAALLIFLGALQYRWSVSVSEAENARVKADLQTSMKEFRRSLARELGALCLALYPKWETHPKMDGKLFAERLEQWKDTTTHDDLVKNVYVAKQIFDDPASRLGADDLPVSLFRLDSKTEKFLPVAWPEKLLELESGFTRLSAAVGSHPPRAKQHSPLHDSDIHSRYQMFWAIHQNIPALVYPMVDERSAGGGVISWLIIELDPVELEARLIPELLRRQFGVFNQFDLRTSIIGGTQIHPTTIYSSDPARAGVSPDHALGTMTLWTNSNRPGIPDATDGNLGKYRPDAVPDESGLDWPEPVRFFAFQDSPDDRNWSVVIESRNGSFEAAISGLRRRNLALSFGTLLILAAAASVLIFTTHRARRLAQLQMDFVTGVTHELRTPLAVIQSAADNIKDGLITSPAHLSRYGGMIHRQTTQLMQLVEQVLLFASSRQTRPKYVLSPVDVNALIDAAMENSGADSVIVEREIEANLPLVSGDFVALTRCLQNLITNAIKYGGSERWLRLKAWTVERDDKFEVNIQVEDHGAGITDAEMAQIFEPFYRSPSVSASNIHGTGLGLPLAKSLAEAVGARITAISVVGKGSSFFLHIPVAAQNQMKEREMTSEVVTS